MNPYKKEFILEKCRAVLEDIEKSKKHFKKYEEDCKALDIKNAREKRYWFRRPFPIDATDEEVWAYLCADDDNSIPPLSKRWGEKTIKQIELLIKRMEESEGNFFYLDKDDYYLINSSERGKIELFL